MKFYETYFGNLLNSISQFCHALAGGASDISMSAKTGYLAARKERHFTLLEKIIDFTFSLVEGSKGHCRRAFYKDAGEDYNREYKPTRLIIFCISLGGCISLLPAFLIISLISRIFKNSD